ncbi:MAG: hypothetical protein CL878_10595 [Dehalococcoidia bacterium]|nr:hypothetical protein [Dehalococcoidia bacterium]
MLPREVHLLRPKRMKQAALLDHEMTVLRLSTANNICQLKSFLHGNSSRGQGVYSEVTMMASGAYSSRQT